MKGEITILMPIGNVIGDFLDWFDMAIKSIPQHEAIKELIIISCTCPDVVKVIDGYEYPEWLSLKKIKNKTREEKTNRLDKTFATQVNMGARNVETKYFTILECDDEYAQHWFDNAIKYMKRHDDVDMFLNLVEMVDSNKNPISMTNEIAWAPSFAENNELGFVTKEQLMEFAFISWDGAIYNTKKFNEIGGIKKKIALSFPYEFLLRMTHNDGKIFIIPKIGYRHTNMKENSLFHSYRHGAVKLPEEHYSALFECAKTEYQFTEDRDIDIKNYMVKHEEATQEK